MDRLLHRGRFAVEGDRVERMQEGTGKEASIPGLPATAVGPARVTGDGRSTASAKQDGIAAPARWWERLGLDREFSRGDRWVTYVSIAWPLLWTALFVGVTVWNLTTDVPDSWWIRFWGIWIWVFTGGALAVTVWFTVGGFADLRYLFRHLRSFVPDPDDDGRVKHDDQA
jgi:hypothetical protein